MTAIVDAHHHLWHPKRGDYGWMDTLPDHAKAILHKPYCVSDLADIWASHRVTKTILVQAAPTVAETEYLLGIADSAPQIGGVIGWIDFEDRSQEQTLRRLSRHPKFLGVRPMIQDLPNPDWILQDGIRWAFDALIERDLVFEALGFPKHLKNFHTVLTRYPALRAVLDHCIKPEIRSYPENPDAFDNWADGMSALAQDTNAVCKFSALVTEAKPDWSPNDLKPFTDHVIKVFEPERLMWGSDWPVALLASSYAQWLETARMLTNSLGVAAQKAIFHDTAMKFYRLAP